jgi:glucose-6-phosphate 1-dehydrogenase
MGLTVMDEAEAGVGQATELEASRHAGPNEMDAYERLLGDALVGDQGLFAREDYVEEAWRIVEPVLKPNVLPQPGIYAPGTWGVACDALTPPGGWHNPVLEEQPG